MTKLRDICRFQSGGTPSRGTPAYFNGNVPWITTVALNGDVIDGNQAIEWITDEAIAKSAAKIVPPHSVMVGTRVGIGKVAINSVPMSTSQDIISLIGIDENKWDKKFICHLITANKEHLTSQARGATIKGIKIEAIADLVLPEISLTEQARISEVIGKVDALMHMHQQMAMNLEQLIKSRFIELFGSISEEVPLSYYIAGLNAGKSLAGEEENPNKVLKTGAATYDYFDATQIKNLPIDYEPQESHRVKAGDVIISRMNTAELVGAAAYVWDVPEHIYLPDRLWRADVKETANPIFVWQVLIQSSTKESIRRIASGTSGSMKNISKLGLLGIRVVKAPINLQQQFAAFVEQTDKSKLAVQKGLQELEILKKSLMQQYFG